MIVTRSGEAHTSPLECIARRPCSSSAHRIPNGIWNDAGRTIRHRVTKNAGVAASIELRLKSRPRLGIWTTREICDFAGPVIADLARTSTISTVLARIRRALDSYAFLAFRTRRGRSVRLWIAAAVPAGL